jgi:hypothetical protein
VSHKDAATKVGKLKAVTVEHGATPAEAATAASLAGRLISRIARRSGSDTTAHATPHRALAPGVHVDIVSRTGLQTPHC